MNECWLWAGSVNDGDYGRMGNNLYAHRVIYEAYHKPIPVGYEIDHLCGVRRCINPEHLEAVTPRENTLRSTNMASRNAKKTHCIRGHEFSPKNTYIYLAKYRRCIKCIRAYDKARALR